MRLYNSLTKQKEEFIPIEPNKISMYVCGQTVYDYCHLGHSRKEVAFDVIRRWFIASGYEVTFVENITDIDDKIITRAIENKETIYQLTDRFINYMHEDFDQLGILRPDIEPKATSYIKEMLKIISSLVEKGIAYQAINGDVYYSVKKFAGYGKLSGRSLDDLHAGERVEVDVSKQFPLDFVLWKAAKENEPYWDSEFGRGRPGWHIECSAMAEAILGKQFDIHGGGEDLKFPHHENEIAQSEAHNNCKFANYWLHNGFLNINEEKMSKSLGNFFTLRETLKNYDAEAIRLLMIKTHYRSPLNFSHELLIDAKNNLTRLYTAMSDYGEISLKDNKANIKEINWDNVYAQKFKAAMDDDFNTSLALSIIFELMTEVNKSKDLELIKLMVSLANILGILFKNPKDYFHSESNLSLDVKNIELLIEERNLARKNKDFELSDKIRDKLLEQKIVLEDTATGTKWRNG